jgi:hypothetical protein
MLLLWYFENLRILSIQRSFEQCISQHTLAISISPYAGLTSPSPGGLSLLGMQRKDSAKGGGPRGPSERERTSHWAGVRASVKTNFIS